MIEVPPSGVEVRPLEIPSPGDRGPRYELIVGPDTDAPERLRALAAGCDATLTFEKGIGAKYMELEITDRVKKQQPEFVIKEWE